MSPTWPLEVLNTMTLSEHGGKTTLTMHGRPINASEEERRTFEAGRDSMQKTLPELSISSPIIWPETWHQSGEPDRENRPLIARRKRALI